MRDETSLADVLLGIELAPAYWAQTRARLDPIELEAELGFVTVPPVFDRSQEQSSPS